MYELRNHNPKWEDAGILTMIFAVLFFTLTLIPTDCGEFSRDGTYQSSSHQSSPITTGSILCSVFCTILGDSQVGIS
jgi:hypothetical protein